MTNSKFIKTINKLFKEINVTYKILQYKKTDKDKFYRGYIYIENMEQLTDEQNQFINNHIYPIFIDNDWEIFFYIGNNIDDFAKEYFPIIEKNETC